MSQNHYPPCTNGMPLDPKVMLGCCFLGQVTWLLFRVICERHKPTREANVTSKSTFDWPDDAAWCVIAPVLPSIPFQWCGRSSKVVLSPPTYQSISPRLPSTEIPSARGQPHSYAPTGGKIKEEHVCPVQVWVAVTLSGRLFTFKITRPVSAFSHLASSRCTSCFSVSLCTTTTQIAASSPQTLSGAA